jgi:hypothetical protein
MADGERYCRDNPGVTLEVDPACPWTLPVRRTLWDRLLFRQRYTPFLGYLLPPNRVLTVYLP